ncbi:pyocin S6 family toxin immunity protein [Pseudomonas fluorescens]|uniref:pyocin S6 family toxin immunity protein n=1 Tax=Pseudomonas fluorescens TaxID=294 RepID=UPI000A812E7A|nr:pyocin S6 family toxin immunity protein [Pseudomonas fluorescens]
MARKTEKPTIQNPPSGDGLPACNWHRPPKTTQGSQYYFWISGFLKGDEEGDFLKYELTVPRESEVTILGVLGWKNLDQSEDGDCFLTAGQVQQIAIALNEQLPTELDLFIGLRG